MKRHYAAGHTLAEMLVVLGVIVVVVSILLAIFIQLMHVVNAWRH